MIVDEYCDITINGNNINYYKNKGYDISNKKITIKTIDLIPGSHKKIKVICDICEKPKELAWREYFRSYSNGNIYCCSSKCSQFKNKKTNIERYGVDNPTKNKEILLRREESNLKKYGVKYPSELESTKDLTKKTNIERYGVDNPTKNKEIYQKVRNTIKNKYGDEVFFKTDHFRKNKNNYFRQYENLDFLKSRLIELRNLNIDVIDILDNEYIIRCENGHEYTTNNDILYKRLNVYSTKLCTICNPINNDSSKELELYDFINSIYDGIILRNVRDLISPHEIDIFIPDLNIGIEFNGVYWHSNKYKDKIYHKNKYEKSKNIGITLIQIWEDDWNYKKDIIKSIIRNKLGLTNNKIYARKCKIVDYTDNKITKEFLNDNHIQGNCKSSIKLGLLFNDELVSLMLFSKNRYGVGCIKKDDYELTRFVVKKNFSVVGSASKLLNHFMKNYKFNSIISFSDCDISNGDMYSKIGFELHSIIKPTYYYLIKGKREHRFKWRKGNLIKLDLLRDGETEFGCMDRMGIPRIYNSGHKKYILNR